MNKSQFFYCYNRKVSEFLKSKGISYIHVAMEPKSRKLYSLYYINNELQSALNEYKKSK